MYSGVHFWLWTLVCAVHSIAFAAAGVPASADHEGGLDGRSTARTVPAPAAAPTKWVSQLFQQAEQNFAIHSAATGGCRRDVDTYRQHLRNQSVWAVRMMESSQWPVIGVFYGERYHMGSWRECLKAEGPEIAGQYCLVQATLDFLFDVEASHSNSKWVDWPDEKASAWSVLKMYETQPARQDRRLQNFALCIPSSCTTSDLEISLSETLNSVFKPNGINISVHVDPLRCQVQGKENHPRIEYYLIKYMFFIYILMVALVSTYDVLKGNFKEEKHKFLAKLTECFSVKRNYATLTRLSSSTYPIIYLMKFTFMCFAIYAHRMLHTLSFLSADTEGVELMYRPISIELVYAAVVDLFFMISGFLTFHFGIVPMTKGGVFYMIMSFVFRWIRMVPMFGVIIIFVIYILPYWGEGPLWDSRIQTEVDNCKLNWWTNLLAINNIVHPDRQCLVISYYIAIDLQLFVLGSVLLYAITKNKKFGIALTVLTLVSATAFTFAVVHSKKYYGHLRLFLRLLEEPRNNEEFTNLYISTYSRIAPYIIGFLAAYLARIIKKKNVHFSSIQIAIIQGVLYTVSIGSQLYAFKFYKLGRPYDVTENALFASLHRLLFVLPFACAACFCVSCGLGIYQKLFEYNISVPLGRLVYGALLVSFLLQLGQSSTQKASTFVNFSPRVHIASLVLNDIVLAFCASVCMYFWLEGPINGLSKLLMKYIMSRSRTKKFEGKVSNGDYEP